MNVRQLISEIKKRQPLWNKSHSLHAATPLREALWEEVSIVVGCPTKLVKTKWKTLKDTFRKEVKRVMTGPNFEPHWVHYQNLEFLLPQLKLELSANDPLSIIEESPQQHIEFICDEVPVENAGKKRKVEYQDETEEFKTEITELNVESEVDIQTLNDNQSKTDENDDEDICFFKSLLPHVKQLSPQKKMLMRMKIQEIVYKEVYAGDD